MLRPGEMPLTLADRANASVVEPYGTDTGMNGKLDRSSKIPSSFEPAAANGAPIPPSPLHDGASMAPPTTSNILRKASDVSSLNSVAAQLTVKTTDANLRLPRSAHRRSSPARYSQPATPSAAPSITESPSQTAAPRLIHRHTLEVPRVAPRLSRDQPSHGSFASDDLSLPNGRPSPTIPKLRRGSLTLGRRATRSIHSDLHLDEPQQDEDASRWAEAYRQRRASRRRKKEEEDDDRVIVGTKVDSTHVNWITAYNMLTGIRFTVSRTNAKLDHELTDADFTAKFKFSFDM